MTTYLFRSLSVSEIDLFVTESNSSLTAGRLHPRQLGKLCEFSNSGMFLALGCEDGNSGKVELVNGRRVVLEGCLPNHRI
jgi:hypothetical protein